MKTFFHSNFKCGLALALLLAFLVGPSSSNAARLSSFLSQSSSKSLTASPLTRSFAQNHPVLTYGGIGLATVVTIWAVYTWWKSHKTHLPDNLVEQAANRNNSKLDLHHNDRSSNGTSQRISETERRRQNLDATRDTRANLLEAMMAKYMQQNQTSGAATSSSSSASLGASSSSSSTSSSASQSQGQKGNSEVTGGVTA